MPELPEVETIRRDLQYALLGKQIRDVQTTTGRCVRGSLLLFRNGLRGQSFSAISRRGKVLVFDLFGREESLLVHLKMTGQLICEVPGGLIVGGHPMAKIDALPNAYTHVQIGFSDGTKLYFNDVRTFGYLSLVSADEHDKFLSGFGKEPLDDTFSFEEFSALFFNRKTTIKAFLLDQKTIAGIGNIYADEICYRARILPQRRVDSLSIAEKRRLYSAIKAILQKAVAKRGTTFANYVDAAGKKGGYLPFLKVYQRQGLRCLRCGDDIIKKTVVAGRGTHFCSSCQG